MVTGRYKGVEVDKMGENLVLNFKRGVSLNTYGICKTPNFVVVSSVDGGQVKEFCFAVSQ